MSSRSSAGNLENVDLCEWNINTDDLNSDKNLLLQLSQEELQKLNAVLSSEQAKILLGSDLGSSSFAVPNDNFAMSRSSMSFAEGKSMGNVDHHDFLGEVVEVESGEVDEMRESSRQISLEHSYCLVPIPDQDIEVQVISEIETEEERMEVETEVEISEEVVMDESAKENDKQMFENTSKPIMEPFDQNLESLSQSLEPFKQNLESLSQSLEPTQQHLEPPKQNLEVIKPNLDLSKQNLESLDPNLEHLNLSRNLEPLEPNSGSNVAISRLIELTSRSIEPNLGSINANLLLLKDNLDPAEEDKSSAETVLNISEHINKSVMEVTKEVEGSLSGDKTIEEAIKEVEEDVKDLEREAEKSLEDVPVRRSRRQKERHEREQLEKIRSENEEMLKKEKEDMETKSEEVLGTDFKLSVSILDIKDTVDALLKMESMPSVSLPSSCSQAVTVEKLYGSDLQPSLMVPQDIFDVTPEPASEDSQPPRCQTPIPVEDDETLAAIEASVSAAVDENSSLAESEESKADESKRGLITDDLFGRVVQKKYGEPVKKGVVVSGERKSYPKRENRKPPGYLITEFEPELFSKPDKMKKIDCRSESVASERSRGESESETSNAANPVEASAVQSERDSDVTISVAEREVAEESSKESKKDKGTKSKGKGAKKVVTPKMKKKKKGAKGQKKKSPSASSEKPGEKAAGEDGQSEGDESEEEDSDWHSEDDPDRLWCICKQPHNDRFMIGCDRCQDWFHGSCVGVTRKQGRELEKSGKEWICKKCEKEMKEGKPREKVKSDDENEIKPEAVKVSVKKTPPSFAIKRDTDGKRPKERKLSSGKPPPSSADAAGDSSQLCIVGCGRVARPNSIFCSNECILQHADESLKIIGKDKARQKASKSPLTESILKMRPDSKRVPVINRKTGDIFQGIKAPFEKDLSLWLKQHPTFEVLSSAKMKQLVAPRKTIKLISAQPLSLSPEGAASVAPGATDSLKTTPLKSVMRSLLEEKKGGLVRSPSVEARSKPSPSTIEARSKPSPSTIEARSKPSPSTIEARSKSSPSTPLARPPIERKPSAEHKSTPEGKTATKVVITPILVAKPKPSPIKRPSLDLKKPVVAEKSVPVSPPAMVGPEPIRLSVKQTLKESLVNRSKDADDLKMSVEEINQISVNIEDELFRLFSDVGTKYKAKYRSLIFNIKDIRNPGLFRKILQGKIPPAKLVRMTAEELASKELAMWREREAKHTLEMIKREQEELMVHAPLIKKTHKGEVEIDDLGFPDRPKPKSDASSEPIGTLLTDTTDFHRSHLFDLNCKICTGKLIPSSSSSVATADDKTAVTKVPESNNKDEEEPESVEEELEREDPEPEEKSEEGEKKETKKEVETESKKEEGKSGSSSKRKKDSKVTKKKSKKVRMAKVRFSGEVTGSESSDREPSSTVSINSPDSAGIEDPNGKSPSVWKGFIAMQDVAKFVTNAYKVSGPTDFLSQDIPDTIQVCGRITPSIVWDYLSKVKHSGNKEFLVIRFAPANEEEKVSYLSFYTYLNSRSRFGVVGNSSRIIKDFYILPLSANDPVPNTLLPFDGPGFEEPRPHVLLGIIIRHRGKRKGDAGDTKTKRSDSLEVSMDADDVAEVIATKKVKFDLSSSTKDNDLLYEPSYTPPLTTGRGASKKKRRKRRSTTPPLPTPVRNETVGAGSSPYSPGKGAAEEEDEDRPYDPEDAAMSEGGKGVSKTLIPGLLSGSVSSQSVSDLIDQISMSSNPAEITTTVLASIATATNLEQQRKLLIELTQKVEEQKRQLEMQKQQIASKVTRQVLGVGVMPPLFTLPQPAVVESSRTIVTATAASAEDEAYSPSYTPPLATTEPITLFPDTSNISLPPNLQEILESIKKQGAAPKEEYTPTALTNKPNVMLEDPIVKNFADLDDDLAAIPVPSVTKTTKTIEEEKSSKEVDEEPRTPPPIKPRDPRRQRMDPRMKGKVQAETKAQKEKKSELSALSAAELLAKAMMQFDEPKEVPKEETSSKEETSTTLKSEPPPPGMEIASSSAAVMDLEPEDIPLPSIPLPPTAPPPISHPGPAMVNYPRIPPFLSPPPHSHPHHHPFLPPQAFMPFPPPNAFQRPPFPGPPPPRMNKGRGGFWNEDPNNGGEWRGRGKFRGGGRGGGRGNPRWERGGGNWNREDRGGDTDMRTMNDFKDRDERKEWGDRDDREPPERFRDNRRERRGGRRERTRSRTRSRSRSKSRERSKRSHRSRSPRDRSRERSRERRARRRD